MYEAFNARDIDAVLRQMAADVDWPNAWEGGRVHGHEGVRDYWTRQWSAIDPAVEPVGFTTRSDGSIAVDPYFETSRQGIFAVGDVHGDIKLIAVAWAEGIQAAIHAFKEITSPYWLNEKRLKDHKIALIGEKIARAASSVRKA